MSRFFKSKTIIDFGLYGFLFFIQISLLTSCDPAIGYNYYINNKSDKELKVFYGGKGFDHITDSILISPKTEILFLYTETWGKNPHDEKDNFLIMFDTLSITATDSSKLLVDYLKRDNWTYSNDIGHLGFIEVGCNIYKIEILNEDFEKK